METIQTTRISICRAPVEERNTVDAIVLGFSTDPVLRWLYPDPASFLGHFPDFVRAFAERAFEHGSAYYTEGFTGGALWLPPEVEPDAERFAGVIQDSAPESKQQIVFEVMEQMDEFHPGGPCWYLPLIGVDPAHQGRGLGTALLQEMLTECDRQQLPAYLESTNPRNLGLYQRHGFRELGIIDTGVAPPMTPMLREPRSM